MVLAVLVAAGGVAAVLLRGGGDGEAADREAFGVAAGRADAAEVIRLGAERPELLEATETVAVATPSDLRTDVDGFVVATVELETSSSYTLAVVGGDAAFVLLDPDGDALEVGGDGRVSPESAGDHSLVIGGSRRVTVTVLSVSTGDVDLAAEQTVELDAPGQVVELDLEVLDAEVYEIALVDAPGYAGRVLDTEGTEVVAIADDGDYQRFRGEEDATYQLVLEPVGDPDDTTSLVLDSLRLARWTSYAGQEGDDHFLEEEVEPTVLLPKNDEVRNAITWCFDVTEGVTISFTVQPSLAGSVWELRSYDSEAGRQTDEVVNEFDDFAAGDGLTLEAPDGDATFCYEMRLVTDGSSSIDLTITDETT